MVALLGSAACSDVTEPTRPNPEPAVAAFAAAAPAPIAGAEIEDLLVRVLPALGDADGVPGLEAALRTLLERLEGDQHAALPAAVEGAERAADAFARSASPGDEVHADHIQLGLAVVRRRIDGTR